MRRLIDSRPVRLALAAVIVAGAVTGLVVLARRRRVRRVRRVPPLAVAFGDLGGAPGREAADRGGPEPILGRPTEEDLRRYDRPEGGAPIARLAAAGVPRSFRAALGGRGRVIAALAVLGLMFAASEALEAVTFPPDRASAVWGFGNDGDAGLPPSPCPPGLCEDPVAGKGIAHVQVVEPGDPPYGAGQDGGLTVTTQDSSYGDPASPGGDPLPARTADPAAPSRCAPGDGPPGRAAPRPVSRRVTDAVNRQWRRVERWLTAHAPATRLGRPASPRLVARAEQRLGVRLPGSLRASLLRHDGGDLPLPPSYRLLSARGIVAVWRATCPAGPGLVPVGTSAEPPGHLMIEPVSGAVAPAPGATPATASWTSYYAMLKAVADALETGRPLGGRTPVVSHGRLRWSRSR
ncbi:SMI1/KNR4 family protein [Microbispora sp. ATCC PTA-5024]|uniref:SMI1/KNR4 family protein n=1 Tax=Microbispora sp. ATCC PTA-5024 TaxID=316330 RepID=UPI000425741A|nr:SMI1/KNR4 family protein [Microbispora sp. ATCC PTA-5024]